MNQEGLKTKYSVDRIGGDKPGARYFVLDYVNDPIARKALAYYAFKCLDEYPQLSQDLWIALRDTANV